MDDVKINVNGEDLSLADLAEGNEKAQKIFGEILNYSAKNYEYNEKIRQDVLKKQEQEVIEAHFNIASGAGHSLAQLGIVLGSRDLEKFGIVLESTSKVFHAACQITGGLGLAAVGGIGLINPYMADIVGVATIFSIFSSDNENVMKEAFDALFEGLQQINDNINMLRQEMHEQFGHVHRELFIVISTLNVIAQQNQYNYQKTLDVLHNIDKFIHFSHNELFQISQESVLYSSKVVLTEIKNGDIGLIKDANELYKYIKTLKYAAYELSYQNIFNNPNIKASDDFKADDDISLQLKTRSLDSNIAFLVNYAKDILGLNITISGDEVPNPAIFLSVANALPVLTSNMVTRDLKTLPRAIETLKKAQLATEVLADTIGQLHSQNVLEILNIRYKEYFANFINYLDQEMKFYSNLVGINLETINHDIWSVTRPYSFGNGHSYNLEGMDEAQAMIDKSVVDSFHVTEELFPFADNTKVFHDSPAKYSKISLNNFHDKLDIDGIYILSVKCNIAMFDVLIFNKEYIAKNFGVSVPRDFEAQSITKKNIAIIQTGQNEYIHSDYNNITSSAIYKAFVHKMGRYRMNFFNDLELKSEYKNYISKLSSYEKMISFYQKLIYDGDGVNNCLYQYQTLLQQYKYSKANTSFEFANNCAAISDKTYDAPNSIYMNFTSAVLLQLNRTLTLFESLSDFKKHSNEPIKNPEGDENSKEVKIYKVLNNYFVKNMKEKYSINLFSNADHEELSEVAKSYNHAKELLANIDFSGENCSQNIADLYCAIKCVDRSLKFNVETYRKAMEGDNDLSFVQKQVMDLMGDSYESCIC